MGPIKYQVRCKLSDKDSGLLENADHGSHIVLVLVITQYLIHMSNQVSSGGIRVKKNRIDFVCEIVLFGRNKP
jgi:hypothetical protein